MPALARAIDSVDMHHYVNEPDGQPLPQSSAPNITEDLLRLADIQPGHRVLEIGTGSGYSTALLAAVVGTTGAVTSIEVDLDVADRATAKLAAVGNATVVCGDGGNGAPSAAPFDRIIAWTTPRAIPQAWTRQIRDGGVIVTPVKVAAVAMANLTVKIVMSADGPGQAELHEGSFVDLTPEAANQTTPSFYIDAAVSHGGPAWLSAPIVRDYPADARALLVGLLGNPRTTTALARPFPVLTAALAAARPEHLAVVAIGRTRGIGYATPESVAVATPQGIVSHGAASARDMLLCDLPGDSVAVSDFAATLSATAHGWSVTITA